MIVRPKLHWLRLLLVWHGSVLPNILRRLVLMLAIAILAVASHAQFQRFGIHLSLAPFSLLGIALAIFLGFRNSLCNERYWEARKLWGGLLVTTRSMLRQAQSLTGRSPDDPEVAGFAAKLIALAYALKHQLRATPYEADLARLLPASLAVRLASAHYPCVLLLRELAGWLSRQHADGRLSDISRQSIDANLNRLSDIIGGCERIAGTPIPYAYSVLLHRTVYLYCLLLPFGLVGDIGLLTPLVSVFISYTFMALDAIAGELEEPFGIEPNDLPLDAMCLTIERSLLEMNDVTDLPAPMQPNRYHILS